MFTIRSDVEDIRHSEDIVTSRVYSHSLERGDFASECDFLREFVAVNEGTCLTIRDEPMTVDLTTRPPAKHLVVSRHQHCPF